MATLQEIFNNVYVAVTNILKVGGAAADNAAAAGNPVLTAGKYNSAAQTYHDGDAATLQTDVNGNLKTALTGSIPAGSNVIGALVDRHEELIKVTPIDFTNKTAGQTYDVPHTLKARAAATFDAPSNPGFSEVTTPAYVAASVQDGSTTGATSSVNTQYGQQLFSFDLLTIAKRTPGIPSNWTVADLKAAIKSLQFVWTGYGVGANASAPANGATTKYWSAAASVWSAPGTGTNTASSPSTIIISDTALTSDITTLINTQGFVHVLAHSTYPSDGAIASVVYTDYIKVEMVVLGQRISAEVKRGVQLPEALISSVIVAVGATAYSPRRQLIEYENVGVYIASTQSYDLMAYGNIAASGDPAANTAATLASAQTTATLRFHQSNALVPSNYGSWGVKNVGAVDATVSLWWVARK